MSRPLFVGSYLQVTWWALGQWKGRKKMHRMIMSLQNQSQRNPPQNTSVYCSFLALLIQWHPHHIKTWLNVNNISLATLKCQISTNLKMSEEVKMIAQLFNTWSICASPSAQYNFAGVKIGLLTLFAVQSYCLSRATFRYINFRRRVSLGSSLTSLERECSTEASCCIPWSTWKLASGLIALVMTLTRVFPLFVIR